MRLTFMGKLGSMGNCLGGYVSGGYSAYSKANRVSMEKGVWPSRSSISRMGRFNGGEFLNMAEFNNKKGLVV